MVAEMTAGERSGFKRLFPRDDDGAEQNAVLVFPEVMLQIPMA